ncbi:UNVERIFIED_CONTAM: Retrovirus-related Pol polyprotein from transposon TNT 1-94 [Sesamum indicum]
MKFSQWTPPGKPQLNGVAEKRNQTLLDIVHSMMSFMELPFWGHALETAAKLLNMAPANTVTQTPYEKWHSKPVSYKYLNTMFLEQSFTVDSQRDESEGTSFERIVPTESAPALRRSTKESRPQIDPPKGVKLVGCKWSTNVSLELMGRLQSSKVGSWQKDTLNNPGSIPRNLFAQSHGSIQILLVVATWYDYEIWRMDVKMAFLNGFVEESIYMDQPKGFTFVGEEQKVFRLQRSIYGLRQASQSWNTHFDEVIRGYDFIKNEFDPSVYKKISGSTAVYLVLYVDNILLIRNDVKMLSDNKA